MDNASLSDSAVFRISQTAERFVAEWPPDDRGNIETLLSHAPLSERAHLFRKLLSAELRLRTAQGESASKADYLRRFPLYAELVELVFAEADSQRDPDDSTVKDRRDGDDDPDRTIERADEAEPTVKDGDQPTVEDRGAAAVPKLLPPPLVVEDDGEAPPAINARYQVSKRLGKGGFGAVYLAFDTELQRQVAIKVPNPERTARPEDVEDFLKEARTLAQLDHPNIVPVYDVGRTEGGLYFVVSKLINGRDLAERLRDGPIPIREAMSIAAKVARALHHAHHQGLVHRDIKPGNILLDAVGNPVVADFGLALKDEDFGRTPLMAGTPAYMSPEQARGEGHLVDGRSDIFSLGIVLYEMLTRRRPFRGDSTSEILRQVAAASVRPPRQTVDLIPKELERICLKALSRRVADRYTTARDMADDLDALEQALALESPGPATTERVETSRKPGDSRLPSRTLELTDTGMRRVVVIPKGLRSFDQHDAEFFLELVPGPRDRDGLPESLGFWKTRIEQTDPNRTFRVGLVYGPSGSGKSSLIKAGLLPQLADHVEQVYLESSPVETEARLLRGLRTACPELDPSAGLVESLALLRRGRLLGEDKKVLLVLDQFEQWLFSGPNFEQSELVDALRHCDGEHVQALVLVRDDFWLAASRFLRALEIHMIEGENAALVDLFTPHHARAVLRALGRAYGALPANSEDFTQGQAAFVEQAVAGLTQDGKVVPVRLAVFAEMFKNKPWTLACLREVGGADGIGAGFLEEAFSAPTAPPEHRLHQAAAQGVLKLLLPESGADIRGRMRTESELRAASGYADRPTAFAGLIRVLDTELRLITPVAVEDPRAESSASPAPKEKKYQLTHDYLVHSLRDWLTRKQRETRQGRAALKLAELAAFWSAKPEKRRLPTMLEWAGIRHLTRKRDWSDAERRMMRAATRRYTALLAGSCALVAALVALVFASLAADKRMRRQVEAASLVKQLFVGQWDKLGPVFPRLDAVRGYWADELKSLSEDPRRSSEDRFRARLALAPESREVALGLADDLERATPPELPVLWSRMNRWKDELIPLLWSKLLAPETESDARRRLACVLAQADPRDPKWPDVAPQVVDAVVLEESLMALKGWVELLRPVRGHLVEPLSRACLDLSRPEASRLLAASALAELGSDQPEEIAQVMLDGDESQTAILFSAARNAKWLESRLTRELQQPSSPDLPPPIQAHRQAGAALVLARLGDWRSVWPLLRQTADPAVRTQLVCRFQASGVSASSLRQGILLPLAPSVRQAVLLALGQYPPPRLTAAERESIIGDCLRLLEQDPDPGVHSAAEWLLRKWGRNEDLRERTARLIGRTDLGNWYVNSQGQTMVVLPGPVEFRMGSPESEPQRDHTETPHLRAIPRSFAIAAHEVTLEQYRRYKPGYVFAPEVANLPDQPAVGLSWYDAVRYCRWLTKEEGMNESDQCYPEDVGPKMKLPDDFFSRKGYRLPTDAEWEYACRCGSATSRFFGDDGSFLIHFGWYSRNSEGRMWPVGSLMPNPWGLFDVYGNALEWCQNSPSPSGRLRSGERVVDDRFQSNPQDDRGLRGGNYKAMIRDERSAKQFWSEPDLSASFTGLRVARSIR